MLLELDITNIALVSYLSVEFSSGFNVLTGETGAGKSIIVDCVNLALGGRADRDIIKHGMDKGVVQAVFDISENSAAMKAAEDIGIDIADGIVAIRRELSRTGRNICRIGGIVLPLNTLKSFTSLLIDVHGQHEHQALMNSDRHLAFLDEFGDSDHAILIDDVHREYAKRSAIAGQLRSLLRDASERDRMVDMLNFQVKEITAAKLKAGEEEKLQRKLELLENSEKIRESVENAYMLLYMGGNGVMSAQEVLLNASQEIRKIASISPKYEQLHNTISELYLSVQDAGHELQGMRDEIESDQGLINRINARLDLIARLQRKYGATVEDVIAYGKDASMKLEAISGGEERISELKQQLKTADKTLREACAALTESRMRLAKLLEGALLDQLKDLGMGKTRFKVEITPMEKPTSEGLERVEFMISANPGEPLKPLSSVASGGELSRIMLAFKAIALDRGGIDSMVFDEIDTGVSGRMAQVVGEKMCMIAVHKQVLCVTHLPQIAALGKAHYLVEKTVTGDSTSSSIYRLDEPGRIRELSRLVGGSDDSESSLSHAAHMLEEAAMVRNRLFENR